MVLLDIRAKVDVAFEGCSFKVNGVESELTIRTDSQYAEAGAADSVVTVDGNSVIQ